MSIITTFELGDGSTSVEDATSTTVTVINGGVGRDGDPGDPGPGVAAGGTSGQVLAKASSADYDTEWVDQSGGGGAVASVNGQAGVVVLDAADVGADASGAAAAALVAAEAYTDEAVSGEVSRADGAYDALGAAAAAQSAAATDATTKAAAAAAASQPLDSDLTAIALLSTTTFGRALLTLADAAAMRSTAGLGTAAVAASTDFDAAGAAAAAQAACQPLDSDLTAIAALTTTTYGRAFLALADAAAGRTALGLGTAATSASTAFDAAGAAAAAQAASQPLDSDLTAIAALTTTTYGRAFLALADAAAGRTALGLGTAATSASTDFQPIDSDLTAIAALTTTSFGRSFLALADAAAGRTLLGLGTLATQSGTFSGTSSGTNTGDQDLSSLAPKASPALTGTPTVPTATPGTNGTQAASSAYVDAATAVETSRATAAEGLKLAKASNLSDLASAITARTNLGLGTAATADTGTTSGTIPLLSTGGLLPIARLATGTPDGTKFVRDDGTLAVPSGSDTSRMRYLADWSSTTSYAVNDVVRSGNKLWACTVATVGTPVTATFIGSVANKAVSAVSFTLAIPGTAAAGDLALIAVSSNTIVAPSYAVTLASGIANTTWRTALYSYTLTAADITATTLTIPAQGAAGATGALHVFRNAAVSGVPVRTTTLTTASLTPPAAAAFVYDVASTAVSTGTAVFSQASLSGVVTASDSASSSTVIGVGYETASVGVATTTRTWSVTNEFGGTADRQTFSVAIVAADSTPFPTGSFALLARTVDDNVNTVTASGSTQTIPDTTTATLNQVTLTAACTFTFPTTATGKRFRLALKQDGSGSRTVTWPIAVKWAGGTTPTLTTTAAKTDHFEFTCYDGANWLGQTLGLNY